MKPTPTKGPKWLSWMEKCIEKKEILLGKTIVEVKIEEGVEDLMKGERKVKQEFEYGVNGGKVGKAIFCLEKNKLEVGELMNIVGLELESSRVDMVKLKKKELRSQVGQGKVVLDSMQPIAAKVENRLQEFLTTMSTIDPNDLNK
jgi:hypothetical protein